jgi:transcriptional regulator with XRE-family HTH domain
MEPVIGNFRVVPHCRRIEGIRHDRRVRIRRGRDADRDGGDWLYGTTHARLYAGKDLSLNPESQPPSSVTCSLIPNPARALGDFIRRHREQLSPTDVGLLPGPRRRTPGLRREEVAQLCGFSATWYTWIEQGRSVSASAEALARIAGALRLSRAERAYLFELAAQHDPATPDLARRSVPDALLKTVDLIDAPAYILDGQWNALAWNPQAAALFVGWLGSTGDRNLLSFTFNSPEARRFFVNWESRARRLVAEFRAHSIRRVNDPSYQTLVESLSKTNVAFVRFWASQDVGEREGGMQEFNHPVQGHVAFNQVTFTLANCEDLQMVMLVKL